MFAALKPAGFDYAGHDAQQTWIFEVPDTVDMPEGALNCAATNSATSPE